MAGPHRKREERLDAAEDEARGTREPRMPKPTEMERTFEKDLMHLAWDRLRKAQKKAW